MNAATSTAAQIRTALKAEGFTSKDVSIRAGAHTVYVTVKNVSVNFEKVAAIASGFSEHVRDVDGDFLSGSLFVRVELSDDVIEPLAARFQQAFEAREAVDGWLCQGEFMADHPALYLLAGAMRVETVSYRILAWECARLTIQHKIPACDINILESIPMDASPAEWEKAALELFKQAS